LNAHQIKSLGAIWGHQDGLLSENELALLMLLTMSAPRPLAVLEVGHFMGLSTCGLVHSLRRASDHLADAGAMSAWHLTTVDAHIADAWVPETPTWVFEENMREHFSDPRVTVRYELSQTLTAPLPFDFVFYDGDHAEEQERFTRAVIDSPRVRTLVFDDRDFPVPARCCEILRAAGWRDESPECVRVPGDKCGAETMTLGVFRRMT
jgi:predicted O-methyltransferase YrrM